MPSPFPGMNPYLEQEDAWRDFHQRYVHAIAASLSPQVDPAYIVKLEQHLYIHELSAEERRLFAHGDVTVSKLKSPSRVNASTEVASHPTRIRLPAVRFERDGYVEVRDRKSREVVTVLELLSPTNKQPGPDREQYLIKRVQLLGSGVHFIEIDLLRGWQRMPMLDAPNCDYCAMVSRVEDRPDASVWPIALRERLPVIPVPLREPSSDVHLELQSLLDGVYEEAFYKNYIYGSKPVPALSAEDTEWARQFLPKAE